MEVDLATDLFEADDCHRSTGDHDEDTEDEEDVEDLVAKRTLGEPPVRNLKRGPRHVFYFRKGPELSESETLEAVSYSLAV